MKIYTKTGDKGTSALWTGERLPKDNLIFDCLGAIDEVNAHLGLVILFSLLMYLQAREYCRQISGFNNVHN